MDLALFEGKLRISSSDPRFRPDSTEIGVKCDTRL